MPPLASHKRTPSGRHVPSAPLLELSLTHAHTHTHTATDLLLSSLSNSPSPHSSPPTSSHTSPRDKDAITRDLSPRPLAHLSPEPPLRSSQENFAIGGARLARTLLGSDSDGAGTRRSSLGRTISKFNQSSVQTKLIDLAAMASPPAKRLSNTPPPTSVPQIVNNSTPQAKSESTLTYGDFALPLCPPDVACDATYSSARRILLPNLIMHFTGSVVSSA